MIVSRLFYCICIIFFFLLSCKKFVDVDVPIHEVTDTVVFQDSASAEAALTGIYVRLNNGPQNMFCGGVSIFTGLTSDELLNTSASTTYDPFSSNSLNANTTSVNSRFWTVAYQIIYQINAVIEGVNMSSELSLSLKKRLLGECYFLRGFIYYYLTQIFGDAPLVISTDYRINATLPRTPVNQLLAFCANECVTARILLQNSNISNRARVNRFCSMSLEARIALHFGEWQKAELLCDSIIQSGFFNLEPNINNVFVSISPEIIWQMLPVTTTVSVNSPEGNLFIPVNATTRPTFILSPTLNADFDNMDLRKSNWTKVSVINNISYRYPFKYKVRTASSITENNIVFRLAEFIFIRAEARARQLKFAESRADLNIIRNRAGLPPVTFNSQDSLIISIDKERRVELFCEWGHRWIDLKRRGTIHTVMSLSKPSNWDHHDMWWPIPFAEIRLNSNLSQNPGY